MLVGSAEIRVEKQGRFKLPAEFASQWSTQGHTTELFATSLLDRRILFYPRETFDALVKSIRDQVPASPHAMRTLHALNRNGAPTAIDKDGRIAIPARLRRTAAERMGFETPAAALLVGALDHIELLFDCEPVQLAEEDLEHLHDLHIAPLTPSPRPGKSQKEPR